jgi:hypothetical protein
MRGIHVFMFFLALPALALLCHDIYMFYVAQGSPTDISSAALKIYTEERPGRGFDFSALGYLWTKYSPDTYAIMGDSMEPAEWASVKAFLTFKAFYVVAGLTGIVYALIGAVYLTKAVNRKTRKFSGKGSPIHDYRRK